MRLSRQVLNSSVRDSVNGGSCAPINPDLRNQAAGFGPHTPHSRMIFKKNVSCLCVPVNVFGLHTRPVCSGFPFTRPRSQAVCVPRAQLPLGGPVEGTLHPRPAGGGFSFDWMDAGFPHLRVVPSSWERATLGREPREPPRFGTKAHGPFSLPCSASL